jgi:hypothetical protein
MPVWMYAGKYDCVRVRFARSIPGSVIMPVPSSVPSGCSAGFWM